jgi:flagellar protein FliJ
MKAFRTLLKLARRDLDTLQRALADQIARQTNVEQRMLGHEQSIRSEQALAQHDYESARAYGGYAVAAVAVRKALQAEKAMIGGEIERLRGLISEAHVEARKFERLIELEEAREKAARDKHENAELDELATQRSVRGA